MLHGWCGRTRVASPLRFFNPFVPLAKACFTPETCFGSSLPPAEEEKRPSLMVETVSSWRPSVEDQLDCLRICKDERDPPHAWHVYLHLCYDGLDSHSAIGNEVVLVFALAGKVLDAHRIYKKLCAANVRLCTSLMWGCIWSGENRMVFDLYEEMMHRDSTVMPNTYTFVALLSACNELQDTENGRMIHGEIVQMGYDGHPIVGSMLLDMYAKLGLLSEGSQVFYGMSVRDVVTWSALIAAYAEEGLLCDVIMLFHRMQFDSISPNAITFLSILKACTNAMSIDKGREFHSEILQRGFESQISIGNNLVNMYAKSGSINEAKKVFDTLVVKDDVAWSALIGSYVEAGFHLRSISCFDEMHKHGIVMNTHGFVCLLKAFGSWERINKGQEVHMLITKVGFEEEIYVGNALVDMYGKCGWVSEAEKVFDNLAYRDVVSWNALMAVYSEYGPLSKLSECFQRMKEEQVPGDPITFSCILKGCGNLGSVHNGREIHMEAMCKAFEGSMLVISALIYVYARCGSFADAEKIFHSLSTPSIELWNALIGGYADQGHVMRVLERFYEMQAQHVIPNQSTYAYVIKAYSHIGSIDQGRATHMQLEQLGFEKDLHSLGIMLIEMYAKSGLLEEAQEVLERLENRKDVLSWNVLINGYAEHGPNQSAITSLKCMQQEGIVPDAFTFSCVIKACSNLHLSDTGKDFHSEIICRGLELDSVIGNTLMDMYLKCDLLAEAENVFKTLPKDDIVSWNTAIFGYAECGCGETAWHNFEEMGKSRVSEDATSYIGILKACTVMTALEKGKLRHEDVVMKGLEGDVFVGSALIGMYSECAALPEAREVLEKLPIRNVVVWNTMVKGCCLNHDWEMAVRCVQAMGDEGVRPDAATFTCLISAFGRTSLVNEGRVFFENMEKIHGIFPNSNHFSCMVDLFARSGKLPEAENLLQTMPCHPARDARRALLTACKTFESFEMGERCHAQLAY